MRFSGLAAVGKTIVQADMQLASSGSESFGNNGTFLIKGEAADLVTVQAVQDFCRFLLPAIGGFAGSA